MWTKNGNVRPGTEARIEGLSSAKAGVARATAIRLATAIRRVIRMVNSSQLGLSGFPEISLDERVQSEGGVPRQHSSETADMSPGAAPIVRANRAEKRLDRRGEQSEAGRTKPVIASSAAASGRPPSMKRVTSAAPHRHGRTCPGHPCRPVEPRLQCCRRL